MRLCRAMEAAALTLVLAAVGCDGSGGGSDAGGGGGDGPGGDAVCPAQLGSLPNTPCPAAAEGLSCTDEMDWCGRPFASDGCLCEDGTWHCWAAGAPAPCHSCCQEDNAADWFCTESGACLQSEPCTAAECCVPGTAGESYCAGQFGDCSVCEPGATGGTCTPTTCE